MDPNELEMCVDRLLQRDMERRKRRLQRTERNNARRMAVDLAKTWENGSTLLISFLENDDPGLNQIVQDTANEWLNHLNVQFEFGDHLESDIRISYLGSGSWSYLGTDAKEYDQDEPTMNFGWLNASTPEDKVRRVVLHEFGHALGAIHEHQSPAGGIPWDRPKVYDFYGGPPSYWSKEDVDVNILGVYDGDVTNSAFDPASIMLYPVEQELTLGDYAVGWNNSLSDTDKSFLGSLYPGRAPAPVTPAPEPEAAVVTSAVETVEITDFGVPYEASIGAHGETDIYGFTLEQRSRVEIETLGNQDLQIALFNKANPNKRIADDDDSGSGYNAKIDTDLGPGEYTVRVWHFWPDETGSYQLMVSPIPSGMV